MRSTIRELKLRHQTQLSLQVIARQLNPLLRGWIEYYGRYAPSALYPLLRHVNQTLVAWAMRKFKRFKDHKVRASQFLQRLAKEQRALFVHWESTIRELKLRHQTQLSLQVIARQLNPLLRGWIEYYGRYAPSALYPLLRHVNQTLVAWAMRKFKRFKDHKVRASQFLQRLAKEQRALFVHWESTIRELKLRHQTQLSLQVIARQLNRVRAAKYTVDGGARGMREVFRSASWPPRLWA